MDAAELVGQLEAANQRADRAEQEADKLWAKLTELRGVSERIAERAAAEAARGAAAALRAEQNASRQWGLRRRRRWVLRRR